MRIVGLCLFEALYSKAAENLVDSCPVTPRYGDYVMLFDGFLHLPPTNRCTFQLNFIWPDVWSELPSDRLNLSRIAWRIRLVEHAWPARSSYQVSLSDKRKVLEARVNKLMVKPESLWSC